MACRPAQRSCRGVAKMCRQTSAATTRPPLQDGTITKKNSPARNVHRLLNTLNFIAAIFENLAKGMTLKVGGRVLGGCWAHSKSRAAHAARMPLAFGLAVVGLPACSHQCSYCLLLPLCHCTPAIMARCCLACSLPFRLPHLCTLPPHPPSLLSGRGVGRVRPHAGADTRVGGAGGHQDGHDGAALPRPLPGLHRRDGCAWAGWKGKGWLRCVFMWLQRMLLWWVAGFTRHVVYTTECTNSCLTATAACLPWPRPSRSCLQRRARGSTPRALWARRTSWWA